MSNAFPIQTNFTSGELSPAMRGRVDTQRYFNGADIIENFHVLPQGGLLRRSGTEFINEVKNSSKLTILKRFVFSTIQSYILEFGENYIRIYREGGVISSGGSPVEIVTTYLESELKELKFSQSADFLYITHKKHPPAQLTRSSDTSWTLSDFEYTDGPYLQEDTSSTELRLERISNTATITSSVAEFAATNVGKFVEYVYKGITYLGKITAYVSPTEVTIEPKENVIDFATIDPSTTLTYASASGGFTRRIRSTLAIWSTNTENTYIKIPDKVDNWEVSGPSGGSGTSLTPTSFAASGTTTSCVCLSGNEITVVAGDVVEIDFNISVGAHLDRIRLVYWDGAAYQEANLAGNRITAASDGFNSGSILANYSGQVKVEIKLDNGGGSISGTTVSEISIIPARDYGTAGTWYLTGNNITANEDIAASGSAAAYSVDVIEVAGIPTVLATAGILSFSDHEITATIKATKNTFDASRDIGRHLRLNIVGDQIWGKLTAISSTTSGTIKLGRSIPLDPKRPSGYLGGAKTAVWRFGAWYVDNYPEVVNFHEGRLNFYSTPLEPQTHWTSKSSDYPNFAPTDNDSSVQDNSAITRTFDSGKINSILWAVTGPVLLVGTVGAEWQVKAQSFNEALTPSNYNAKEQTSWGSENISPERIGQSLIYVQVGGVTVRELVYSFEIDSFIANHLNIAADHVFRDRGKAVDIAYERNPYTRIWFAASNGELVCVTFEKSQEVTAWNHHVIAGDFNGGNAVVESVESLPGQGEADEVYLVVKRTINGNTKRYVERFKPDFWPMSDADKTSMAFVDSHLTYSGAPVGTVSGLDHLEGETVQIVGDGSVRPSKVVTGGQVAIEGGDASEIVVGLQYKSIVKLLPIEAGSQSGTAQGKVKRINALVVRLYSSIGFRHGTKLDNLTPLSFRATDDPMDSSPPFFSGDKKITLDSTYDTLSQYYVEQDQPYPLVLLALMPQLVTHR